MSFDWNASVKTPGPQLIGNLAGATRERLRALSFTKNLEPPDHKHWLENTTIRLIEGFARWYLSEHEINHQSGLHTFIQFFRMYWRKKMGRELPQEIRRGLTNLVNVKLTQEFNLDLTGKAQPSVNIDDLL